MPTASETSGRRRVLIVDDIEVNRLLTEAVLRTAYDVDSVGDGSAAIAAVGDGDYDLVLMDLEMPGLCGHDAASAIRQRVGSERVKVAALTSLRDDEARARSKDVGMAAHIARPISPSDLLRELEKVLRQPSLDGRGDPWQRELYDQFVTRLGDACMHGFLIRLRGQFRDLLGMLGTADRAEDARRAAHDVASTGGMLGFMDVTLSCRRLLEATDDVAAHDALVDAVERAVTRLDGYISARESVGTG